MLKQKHSRLLILLFITTMLFVWILLYKNLIVSFIKKYGQKHHSSIHVNYELKDNDIEDITRDLNIYLENNNQPQLIIQTIPELENQELYEKLESTREEFVVVDIRENLELATNRLPQKYSRIKYIRLGDLINNNFEGLEKNSEIILISFGQTRAYAAALYLKTNNYSNVKVLRGGILKWAQDNFPMEINNYGSKDLFDSLKHLNHEELNKLPETKIISFGPALQKQNIQPIFWDTKTLSKYIYSLSKERSYILSCSTIKYCYDAIYFWHEAKNSVNIIGYTGI